MLAVVGQLGEILGSLKANQTELGRLNLELVRMSTEVDAKHKENMDQIRRYHEESGLQLTAHKEDDNRNFGYLRKWLYLFSGGLFVLWTVFQFVIK